MTGVKNRFTRDVILYDHDYYPCSCRCRYDFEQVLIQTRPCEMASRHAEVIEINHLAAAGSLPSPCTFFQIILLYQLLFEVVVEAATIAR